MESQCLSIVFRLSVRWSDVIHPPQSVLLKLPIANLTRMSRITSSGAFNSCLMCIQWGPYFWLVYDIRSRQSHDGLNKAVDIFQAIPCHFRSGMSKFTGRVEEFFFSLPHVQCLGVLDENGTGRWTLLLCDRHVHVPGTLVSAVPFQYYGGWHCPWTHLENDEEVSAKLAQRLLAPQLICSEAATWRVCSAQSPCISVRWQKWFLRLSANVKVPNGKWYLSKNSSEPVIDERKTFAWRLSCLVILTS